MNSINVSEIPQAKINPTRKELIQDSLDRRDAISINTGALATWTPPESTGRSPKDTYIVKHTETAEKIDWSSPTCIPMDPETFDMLFEEAYEIMKTKKDVYVLDRVIGADAKYALPVKTIVDRAVSALFLDNMFRAVPENINDSIFAESGFTMIVLPSDKIKDPSKYEGRLRKNGDNTSDMVVAMDFDRKLGIVYGHKYCGSMKKLLFTVMNYLLPEYGMLPLHCSANEGKKGDTALFLGLSGTGKTTLSSDPNRALIGDDEHGWSLDGIANFENGCYAKLIDLRKDKEPEIYNATFHEAPPTEHGAIIENAMVFPEGNVDVNDTRLTQNSRVSYPLTFLQNTKASACGDNPETIIFLTADASGVLPPVAKLTPAQAKLWFLMGYTSKLAGTETGVTEPQATFSRFFGGPFMPRNPGDYTKLFGQKIESHNTYVYLVNTGWSGGSYGVGSRMDINVTRSIVNACLDGSIENADFTEDKRFHIMIPNECPNVESNILTPKNTWENKETYDNAADNLANKFSEYFDANYAESNVEDEVRAACPGK